MNLEFYNCPKPENISSITLPEDIEFLTYTPDFLLIDSLVKAYGNYKNILIIGNGGSINPFLSAYLPLKKYSNKDVYILNTIDPDYIFELKQKLKIDNTLVLSISKSGENIQQIESTLQFSDFSMLVITGKSSPLRAILEKLNKKIILHSKVGGRYTTFTETALLPLALCGFDYKSFFNIGREYHNLFFKPNPAYETASIFFQLENLGYIDVLMFFYSHFLFGVSNVAIQLFHESFGKEGKGQTYFAHEGPEVQHHTTQRFFGGRKNIAGMFFTVENFENEISNSFPIQTHSAQIKLRHLSNFNNLRLSKSFSAEWRANLDECRIKNIPTMHLSLNSINLNAIAKLSAFFQLFAVYSSVLRAVDPFDQPQVESSKNSSFNERLKYQGLM